MTADEAIRELEERVTALLRRPVQIVVVRRDVPVPAHVAAGGNGQNTPAPLHTTTPADGASSNGAEPSVSGEPEGRQRADANSGRRTWQFPRLRRPAMVDGAGCAAVGLTLAPAVVAHGSAQAVLLSVGSSLVAAVAGHFVSRVSRERESS